MAEILACRRGLVATLPGCSGAPGRIRLSPNFDPLAALIDAPSVSQQVNVQFQPSLGGPVYVYVFGDQMGNISISGTVFAGLCGNASNSGLREIVEYYNSNRASQRSEVVTVTYGSDSFEGFLTKLMLRPQDPLAMLTGFTIVINTLPKE